MRQNLKRADSYKESLVRPGERFKNGTLFKIRNNAHSFVEINNLFANKRVAIFMGPAPFSRLDKQQAVEYEQMSSEILTYVDEILGIYCQDAFVMQQFENYVHEEAGSNNVQFWGDGDGTFCRMNTLLVDFVDQGLGWRSGRWAFVLNNGEIEYVAGDEHSELDLTSADDLLEFLREDSEA